MNRLQISSDALVEIVLFNIIFFVLFCYGCYLLFKCPKKKNGCLNSFFKNNHNNENNEAKASSDGPGGAFKKKKLKKNLDVYRPFK